MTRTIHLPLTVILRGIRSDEVLAYTQVLVDAGFDAIEISLNSPNWAQSVQLVARVLGDRASIGVGTALRSEGIDLMVMAGGKLVVTPNTHAPMVRAAAQVGLATCIGCTTTTKAFVALDVGAQVLKTLPAGVLGPGYARTFKTVLPAEAPVFVVGSITPENLADYLTAGCIDAGLGSDLYYPGQLVGRTAERVCAFVTVYRSAQSDRI